MIHLPLFVLLATLPLLSINMFDRARAALAIARVKGWLVRLWQMPAPEPKPHLPPESYHYRVVYRSYQTIPGSGNKGRVGQKVEVLRARILWEVRHFLDMYSVAADHKTFQDKSFREMFFWLGAHSGRFPILDAEVVGFGAEDDSDKDRLNLRVRMRNVFGTIETLLLEDEVKLIRRSRKLLK